MVLSHYPPDLILAHLAQMLGKQSPIPAAVASRRRLIEHLQDPLLGGRIVLAPLFSRPGSVQRLSPLERPHENTGIFSAFCTWSELTISTSALPMAVISWPASGDRGKALFWVDVINYCTSE